MEVVVTGHNFESILPKDHPCHVCFKLADWFQRRRLLNNISIGPMLKLCADGGHFGLRSGSLNTILAVDHLRTIDDMFAILADWFQRRF
jgi:c-di-GMP-binding flagellar brake protein YcgR